LDGINQYADMAINRSRMSQKERFNICIDIFVRMKQHCINYHKNCLDMFQSTIVLAIKFHCIKKYAYLCDDIIKIDDVRVIDHDLWKILCEPQIDMEIFELGVILCEKIYSVPLLTTLFDKIITQCLTIECRDKAIECKNKAIEYKDKAVEYKDKVALIITFCRSKGIHFKIPESLEYVMGAYIKIEKIYS
jgi:hypothetical protein